MTSGFVLAAGCGGRTETDLGEYDPNASVTGGTSATGGGPARGGSTSSGGTGSSTGGSTSRGGNSGRGGSPNISETEKVLAQCQTYCDTFAARCPREERDIAECSSGCKELVTNTQCLSLVSNALACTQKAIEGVNRCPRFEDELERACGEVIFAATTCMDEPGPDPNPGRGGAPGTGGGPTVCYESSGSGSTDYCTSRADCTDGAVYDVGCKRASDTTFSCYCSMQRSGASTSAGFDITGRTPDCATALRRCGAPMN
jgi:hypothetical protein